MIQIVIPFLIAGMGMVCAGVLLDEVQVGYHLLEILINYYKIFSYWNKNRIGIYSKM